MTKYENTNEWRVVTYDKYGGGTTTIGRLYDISSRQDALQKARELYPNFDTVKRVVKAVEEDNDE